MVADAVGILPNMHVAGAVQLMLNAPVAADASGQLGHGPATQAGDVIRGFTTRKYPSRISYAMRSSCRAFCALSRDEASRLRR